MLSDHSRLLSLYLQNNKKVRDHTVETVGIMHGLLKSPIENVTFKNCDIKANKGLVLENVKNLDVSGLEISVNEGEAVIRRSVE